MKRICEDCGYDGTPVLLYCAYPANLCIACAAQRMTKENEATVQHHDFTKNVAQKVTRSTVICQANTELNEGLCYGKES